jgi:hypothetical protein
MDSSNIMNPISPSSLATAGMTTSAETPATATEKQQLMRFYGISNKSDEKAKICEKYTNNG